MKNYSLFSVKCISYKHSHNLIVWVSSSILKCVYVRMCVLQLLHHTFDGPKNEKISILNIKIKIYS